MFNLSARDVKRRLICIRKTSHFAHNSPAQPGISPLAPIGFRMQTTCLAKYANDIRKNWHSGRLKVRGGLNLNCKFSTIDGDFFSVAENGKNFHFSARYGMSSRRCDDYLMPSLAIRINDYEFTQSLRRNILLEEFPAQSFLRSLRGCRGEARLKIASTPIVTKSSVLKERRHSTSLGGLWCNDMLFSRS